MDETGEISKKKVTRRDFLKLVGLTAGGLALPSCAEITSSDNLPEKDQVPELTEEKIRELIQNSNSKKGREKLDAAIQEVALKQQTDMELWNSLPLAMMANSVRLVISNRIKDGGKGSGIILWHGFSPQISSDVAIILTSKHNILGKSGEVGSIVVSRPHLAKFGIETNLGEYNIDQFSYFTSPEKSDLAMIVVHDFQHHDVVPAQIKISENAGKVKVLSFPGSAESGIVSSGVMGGSLSVENYDNLVKIRGCLVSSGSSGGGLFNENGELSGIVTSGLVGSDFLGLGEIPEEDYGYAYAQMTKRSDLQRFFEGTDAKGVSINEMYKLGIVVDRDF